jgi:hypothetical protein
MHIATETVFPAVHFDTRVAQGLCQDSSPGGSQVRKATVGLVGLGFCLAFSCIPAQAQTAITLNQGAGRVLILEFPDRS